MHYSNSETMMTNKLILNSEMENQTFQLNLCLSQKQLHPNQFTQNVSSHFVKKSISSIEVTKIGVVN